MRFNMLEHEWHSLRCPFRHGKSGSSGSSLEFIGEILDFRERGPFAMSNYLPVVADFSGSSFGFRQRPAHS